jgi:muconolactone D-isomerase
VEFLVYIRVELPADYDSERVKTLREEEAARGVELYEDGVIRRIWRVPGRREAVGIWQAADPTELHELLASLPLFPWCDIEVTPLATHYVESLTQDSPRRRQA